MTRAIESLPVPTTMDELEDTLRDPERLRALTLGAKGEFAEFIRNYARAVNERDAGIDQQIREEVERVTAAWLRENTLDQSRARAISAGVGKALPTKLFNPKAPGGAAEGIFDSLSEFTAAVWDKQQGRSLLDKRGRLGEVQNSLGSSVPADGGFLIPETMRSELLRVALESAIVRPRARVIPMESLRVPFPTIDATSNASNVYGGVTAFWTEEAAQLAESQPRFGRVVLEARKLTAYSEVPNELLSDSIVSMTTLLNEIYPEAIAWFEDLAFLRGTGVGEPFGVYGAPAMVATAAEVGQPANSIVWENIVKMYARMLPSSLGRAVWLANINTFPELATMALAVGTGGSAIWLNNGAAGPPVTILGRPVIFTEKAATLGTATDISFIDFGYYLIGDRQVMQGDVSVHYRFRNDQTAMRFIERVDGRPWLQSAITPNQGSTTLSPFVSLATRA